jgi:hypothetical protein
MEAMTPELLRANEALYSQYVPVVRSVFSETFPEWTDGLDCVIMPRPDRHNIEAPTIIHVQVNVSLPDGEILSGRTIADCERPELFEGQARQDLVYFRNDVDKRMGAG